MDHKEQALRRLKALRDQTLPQTENMVEVYRNKSDIDTLAVAKSLEGEFYEIRKSFEIFIAEEPIFRELIEDEDDREDHMRRTQSYIAKIGEFFDREGIPMSIIAKNANYACLTSELFFNYSISLIIKQGVNLVLAYRAIFLLGTEKHNHILESLSDYEEVGGMVLTEIGHGSNVQQLGTTATYDETTEEFIINTPNEMAMKFWIGGASKTATLGVVWAQLISKGKNYGVHAFVVRFRDRKTHEVLPDLTIGDCGPKIGVHGIDNGFIVFHQYRVPRSSMLDKLAQITKSGEFVSDYKPSTLFGLSLSALSTGRITIASGSARMGIVSSQIAIRYACVRKQFGKKGEEQAIIEYPLHQYRLMVPLVESITHLYGIREVTHMWEENKEDLFD